MKEIAILMAAGLGTRMRPLTEKKPKPLVEVCGTPMIETVISALQERKVEKIYIVVGYMKEKFDYLCKKYENIVLVENKEYLVKNNISSLYAVRNIIGDADCFICEADLYITDRQLLKKVNESCYFGKMVEGYSEDWIFETKNNRITKIKKGGEDKYNMCGISFWKKEDVAIINNAIVDEYKKVNHENLFWDEIVDKNLKTINAKVYPVECGSIIEIDTVEELSQVDESYK